MNIYIHKRKRNYLEIMILGVTSIFKEKRGRPLKHFQNIFIFIIMLIFIFIINIQIVFIFIYLEKYCGKIELIYIFLQEGILLYFCKDEHIILSKNPRFSLIVSQIMLRIRRKPFIS